MKTKIFKMVLPMLVVVLGVTSAFTTAASQKESTLTTVGWEQHIGSEIPCVEKVQNCQLAATAQFCRVGAISTNPRLYDMNASDNCIVPLYKP